MTQVKNMKNNQNQAVSIIAIGGIILIISIYLLIPLICELLRLNKPEFKLPSGFWWSWTSIIVVWIISKHFGQTVRKDNQ